MIRAAVTVLLLSAVLAGCVRREGRNSDCKWPGEPAAQPLRVDDPGHRRHLASDVEFAEELAIRYMDAHAGSRSPARAAQAKNQCLGSLLGEIGKAHSVSAQQAFRFFGRRSLAADLAMSFPFAVLCLLSARRAGRRMSGDSIVLIVFAALCLAALAVLLGEQWSILAESARVGNWHLSSRAERLPWTQHRAGLFVAFALLFLAARASWPASWRRRVALRY